MMAGIPTDFLAYAALGAMGIILGVLGAGGSILTIPILVYLCHLPVSQATHYSLVIVGAIAFLGTIRHRKNLLIKNALLVTIPSLAGVYFVRAHGLPYALDILGNALLDQFLLGLLIFFMIAASAFMIGKPRKENTSVLIPMGPVKTAFTGLCLGVVTGTLGAGGGFLIVPTLVLGAGLTMSQAVPTSLFIIAVNAGVGVLADTQPLQDGGQLAKYLVFAFLGLMIGSYLFKFIPAQSLRKGFGWFVLTIAMAMLMGELEKLSHTLF